MSSAEHALGFWGLPTGDPDWCEENYVVTHYVAEFWNTLSSLPLVFVGLYGLYKSFSHGLGWQFGVCWAALALVGAGSTAFHGTLLFAGQAADELAMVYCVVAFLLVQLGSRRVTLSVCLVYLPAFTWVHLRLYIRGLAS